MSLLNRHYKVSIVLITVLMAGMMAFIACETDEDSPPAGQGPTHFLELVVDPIVIPADETSDTNVTAIITDLQTGQGVSNEQISFSVAEGVGEWVGFAGETRALKTTNQNGVARVKLRSTSSPGRYLINAVWKGLTNEKEVIFSGYGIAITLSATDTRLFATETDSTIITAKVMENWVPKDNINVWFNTNFGDIIQGCGQQNQMPTNSNGEVSVEYIPGYLNPSNEEFRANVRANCQYQGQIFTSDITVNLENFECSFNIDPTYKAGDRIPLIFKAEGAVHGGPVPNIEVQFQNAVGGELDHDAGRTNSSGEARVIFIRDPAAQSNNAQAIVNLIANHICTGTTDYTWSDTRYLNTGQVIVYFPDTTKTVQRSSTTTFLVKVETDAHDPLSNLPVLVWKGGSLNTGSLGGGELDPPCGAYPTAECTRAAFGVSCMWTCTGIDGSATFTFDSSGVVGTADITIRAATYYQGEHIQDSAPLTISVTD